MGNLNPLSAPRIEKEHSNEDLWGAQGGGSTGGTAGGRRCGKGEGNRIDERRPLGSCGCERVDFFSGTTKKRSTDQQTDMQLRGQKKRKIRESEKTKSVDKEIKKINRSTDRHATDLIFGDTLLRYDTPLAVANAALKLSSSRQSFVV